MLIRQLSDVHLEQAAFIIPPMKDDRDTILILSGDIANAVNLSSKVLKFFESFVHRFKAVLYVPGNHEYYGGRIEECDSLIKQWLLKNNYNNVHFLNKADLMIDGVAFIGAALWTDVRKGNPIDMSMLSTQLNDYHYITKNAGNLLSPHDTILIHHEHRQYIFDKIASYRTSGARKIVVITHHAPSELSVVPRFRNSPINSGFVSDMFEDITNCPPDIWFHGHCHDSVTYNIDNTIVHCNPRGYAKVHNLEKYEAVERTIQEVDIDSVESSHIMVKFEELFRQENSSFNPYFRINI